jgi:lysophospholipase L1-like esterase
VISAARLLAVALALASLVFAGCAGDDDPAADGTLELSSGTVPPDGPGIVLRPDQEHPGRLVAVVGDSITVGSTPGLVVAADALDVDLVINAEVGRRITVGDIPGTVAVEQVYEEVGQPDLWVIALGTNDVAQYESAAEYTAQIEALLALIPPEDPLVWINVYLTGLPDQSAQFNRALSSALTARGNASIGEWTDFATDHGVLSDGIHPSDEGRLEFVDVIANQIDDWMD